MQRKQRNRGMKTKDEKNNEKFREVFKKLNSQPSVQRLMKNLANL